MGGVRTETTVRGSSLRSPAPTPQPWTPGHAHPEASGVPSEPPGETAGSGLHGVVWLGQGAPPITRG
jgi:hypothetical protein